MTCLTSNSYGLTSNSRSVLALLRPVLFQGNGWLAALLLVLVLFPLRSESRYCQDYSYKEE